jgi:polar amino acid transport system permease protein
VNWLGNVLRAVPTTVGLWALALVIGMALAMPVCAARMSRIAVLRMAAIVWIEVLRGVPTLIWLFVVFFGISVLGHSPTAYVSAVLALSAVNSAYFAEVYRSGFESVGAEQREALQALGMTRLAGARLVLLPQALPIIVAGCGSFAILVLKETALASLIGVVEIMNVANYEVTQGANGIKVFLATGLIYTALCLPIGVAAHVLGQRLAARTGLAKN